MSALQKMSLTFSKKIVKRRLKKKGKKAECLNLLIAVKSSVPESPAE
jgi:hypothetical protein